MNLTKLVFCAIFDTLGSGRAFFENISPEPEIPDRDGHSGTHFAEKSIYKRPKTSVFVFSCNKKRKWRFWDVYPMNVRQNLCRKLRIGLELPIRGPDFEKKPSRTAKISKITPGPKIVRFTSCGQTKICRVVGAVSPGPKRDPGPSKS